MENVLRQELEKEEAALATNQNSSSWKRYIGLNSTTNEEKSRQACVKELDKIFLSRQQLDQTMKNNQAVTSRLSVSFKFSFQCLISYVRLSIKMN